MDFNSILTLLRPELSLLAIIIILLIYDLFAGVAAKKYFQPLAWVLMAAHTAWSFCLTPEGTLFGGMFATTQAASLVKAILSLATLIVFLQAGGALSKAESSFKTGEFYMLTLSTLFGMNIMISSGHFLMFYLGLETASIPLACLVAFDKYKQNSAEAAAKYILNAALSSGILVYGLSFIYGTCGTLYFANVPSMLDMTVLQVAGLVMFLAGMGFKISLVPFHMWTPDVYQGAPTSVTAYLSVVSKGAAAFALMTVLFKVFAPMAMVWQDLMYGIIILTITLANLFAIRQKDIKRFFAYSSISQAGYVVLGIMAGTAEGMTAMIYYILVYILSNLAAFGVISTVENHTGRVNIDQYNGLYSTNPRMAFVMMLALFSLGGIPPFAGFFSKFFIFTSAAASGYYVLVFIALVNTIISLYYYLLVVKAMFINKTDAPAPHFRSEKALVFSLAICVAGIILAGIASCLYGGIGEFTFGM